MGSFSIDRIPYLAMQWKTCVQHQKTTEHLAQSWVGISKSDAQKLSELDAKNDLLFARLKEQVRQLSPADKSRFDQLIADCV